MYVMRFVRYICIFLAVFLLISHTVVAAPDSLIRARAFDAPDSVSKDIKKLTRYLIKPYKDDYDKAKVIAYWIASHMAYDYYKMNSVMEPSKRIDAYKYDSFDSRTGICDDYAKLFQEMGEIAGLDVSYESGYILNAPLYAVEDESRHAWNEVKIDGRTFYVDTTFMSNARIGNVNERVMHFRHKKQVKEHQRKKNYVNESINDFYFDFDNKTENKKYRRVHVSTDELKRFNKGKFQLQYKSNL